MPGAERASGGKAAGETEPSALTWNEYVLNMRRNGA